MPSCPPRPPHPKAPSAGPLAFVALALVASLLSACGEAAPKAPPAPTAPATPTARPNVVFIDVSGLRYDTVHRAEGQPAVMRPFHALAREGSDFRAAVAPAAWETPSIACVLTGLLPDWTGVKGRAGKDRPTLIPVIDTLAELLGGHGYECAAFVTKPADPVGGVPRTARLDQGFATWKESSRSTETGAAVLDALAARAVPPPPPTPAGPPPAGPPPPSAAPAPPAPAAPLFLFVHLDATLPLRDDAAPPKPEDARTTYGHAVDAASTALEMTLGAVARHLPGDTLVVLFSDHGEALGDRPGVPATGRDGAVTDEQIRVPLVIRGRGFPKAVVSGSCSLVDLAPTVIEALGLPPVSGLSGTALQPLAAHPGDPGLPQFALAWRTGTGSAGRAEQTLYAVRSTKAKFVATFSDRPPAWTEELFDLTADPGERKPLPADNAVRFGKDLADRIDALRGFLGGRQTHLTDPIVVPYVAGGGGGSGPTREK